MAQTESKTPLANLNIESSFQDTRHRSGQSGENERRGGRESSGHYIDGNGMGVLNELHSSTPPISVPRANEAPSSFASPLGSAAENRRPSICLKPDVTVDDPLEELVAKDDSKSQAACRLQTRSPSGLRNAPSPNENAEHDSASNTSRRSDGRLSPQKLRVQRTLPGKSSRLLSSPDDSTSMFSELDRLSSITSVSPASEVQQTPPESKEDFPVVSPVQDHERGSWSTINPVSKSPRNLPSGRTDSLRLDTRRTSRRSTGGSSGKSPAHAFLSKWNSREEPAPQPDDEGQMVGPDYVLGKEIGFGGFSYIKEAFKLGEHGEMKRLAVKVVKKQVPGKSEFENDQVQAEFDHEVRVWRFLNDPHVLTLDAVYETDYATFCFTKFAIGGTLFDLVRQNRRGVDMRLAKKYTHQLACALRYLHEDARVVHRDIKLENCLLDPVETEDFSSPEANLLLCDFGMAEWMTTDAYEESADRPPPKSIGPSESSTSVAGSLEYASPELLLSTNGVIDPAVDMWAFGVVVFSMVVGSRPFQDPFTPRVRSSIITGNWNRELALGDGSRDRADAFELINGCLELNVDRRWTIQDVLSSKWLRDYPDCSGENAAPQWNL